jgi:uncharacterized protein YjbI with pentapeptide repeats
MTLQSGSQGNRMADEEHVALLKQGAKVWNKWRKENPDVIPKLSYSDLRRADLRKANLSKADLEQANLTHADCGEADFTRSTLIGAELVKANFAGAVLRNAWIGDDLLLHIKTFVTGANFYGADLTKATRRNNRL